MGKKIVVGDALADLRLIKWRGLTFPIANLKFSFKQPNARHKKPDRPGVKLENTKREEFVWSGRAIFDNGVVFEPQTQGVPLFPDLYRAVRDACLDGSTGDFVDPIEGDFRAKCESFDRDLNSERRGGVSVDISWAEDTEEDDAEVATAAPFATAVNAAADLDGFLQEENIKALVAATFKKIGSPSFTDLVHSLQASTDQVKLLQQRGFAQINRVQNQVGQMRDAFASARDVSVSNARQANERLSAALYDLKATVATATGAGVGLQVTQNESTLGQLAASLHVRVTDLIRLNPGLVGKQPIPRSTSVRYLLK